MKNLTLTALIIMLSAITTLSQPQVVEFEIVEQPLTLGALPLTASGQKIWGDINNNGLLDFLIVAGQGDPFSGFYMNNGDGTFTEVLTDISMLSMASAAFFDFDNDGYLDVIVAGSLDGTSTAAITELYRNSGAPNYEFVLVGDAEFVGISGESTDNSTRMIEVVDYNNDGWLDIFISGNAGGTWDVSGNSRVVALYTNNQGTFQLNTSPVDGNRNFRSMNGGGIHCGDLNNDGYADMIVSGYVDGEVETATDLYINNGDGTFSYFEDSNTLFTGQMQGETFFADINNDGKLDIIEVGRDVNQGWAHFANIFINDGNLQFTLFTASQSNLIGGGAVVASGDINNDGQIDLVFSGWGPGTTFFYNNGDSTFTRTPIIPDRARARGGSVNFVDFTKDGTLDFTIFGWRDGGDGTYENPNWPNFLLKNNLAEGIVENEPPTAPQNFTAREGDNKIVLSWDNATDDITPAEALRYNIFVKAKDGSSIYTYFPVDTETGWLKASGERPLISGNTITLHGVTKEDYIFGVQAIDNAKLGGTFATEINVSVVEPTELNIKVYSYKGRIHINNYEQEAVNFRILNINGQIVLTGISEPESNHHVNLNKAGVYIVQVWGSRVAITEKVVVF